jgi:glutaredoxin
LGLETMYIIITRDQCNFCDTAKALLRNSNIPYVTYNVQSENSKWLLDLIKKAGYTTVPQVWNNKGEHIGGYTELRTYLLEDNHSG